MITRKSNNWQLTYLGQMRSNKFQTASLKAPTNGIPFLLDFSLETKMTDALHFLTKMIQKAQKPISLPVVKEGIHFFSLFKHADYSVNNALFENVFRQDPMFSHNLTHITNLFFHTKKQKTGIWIGSIFSVKQNTFQLHCTFC